MNAKTKTTLARYKALMVKLMDKDTPPLTTDQTKLVKDMNKHMQNLAKCIDYGFDDLTIKFTDILGKQIDMVTKAITPAFECRRK